MERATLPRSPSLPRSNSRKTSKSPAPSAAPPAAPRVVAHPRHVALGDVLKIERRYVVDGALTSVTDQGKFKGVQVLGSTEHLIIEDNVNRDVRMIPLFSISEITIVAGSGRPDADAFDPSVV